MTENTIHFTSGEDPVIHTEVIRIDKHGFHYRGQFIEDAGEAHRLLVEFLRTQMPEDNWKHADDVLEIPGHGRVSCEEAEELLAMMLNGMRVQSARMNSQHEWRIPGPALGRLVGRTALDAMLNALPANRHMIYATELEDAQ